MFPVDILYFSFTHPTSPLQQHRENVSFQNSESVLNQALSIFYCFGNKYGIVCILDIVNKPFLLLMFPTVLLTDFFRIKINDKSTDLIGWLMSMHL